MLFTTASMFRNGTTFGFTLLLDHTHCGWRQEIACEGVVVRTELGDPDHRVAVSINSHDIGPPEATSESAGDDMRRD
jgi:hypothetical protein